MEKYGNKRQKTTYVLTKIETGKNAARERTRVKSLRLAFQRLQSSIPTIPPDTKLSKLDILVLATNYISHLGSILANDGQVSNCAPIFLHPIKKWPMRSRLYLLSTNQHRTSEIVSDGINEITLENNNEIDINMKGRDFGTGDVQGKTDYNESATSDKLEEMDTVGYNACDNNYNWGNSFELWNDEFNFGGIFID